MEQGRRELMGLLRAFVHETPLTQEEFSALDLALPEVLSLCRLHGVMGIWAYKVREYYFLNGAETEDARQVYETAENLYTRTISHGVKREHAYQQLSGRLAECGIDHLAFKGIVVKDLYPVPQLRSFGDIDLAIRKEDRASFHALMQEAGYATTTDFEPVYTYKREGELYEVHTSIMAVNITDRADYIDYFQGMWEHTKLLSPHVLSFTPEFHFVYLLSHIAKHIYSSGAGVRMYLDLALYVKKLGETLNWQWIEQELATLCLTDFFHLAMEMVSHWFSVPSPVAVSTAEEELVRQFEAFTLDGGVFGFEGRTAGEQMVRKEGVRGKALLTTLFPSAKTIQSRYTYLQKHPYLLPVAWVDRFLRNQNKIGKIAAKTNEIIHTDQKEVQKVKEFYHKIGL